MSSVEKRVTEYLIWRRVLLVLAAVVLIVVHGVADDDWFRVDYVTVWLLGLCVLMLFLPLVRRVDTPFGSVDLGAVELEGLAEVASEAVPAATGKDQLPSEDQDMPGWTDARSTLVSARSMLELALDRAARRAGAETRPTIALTAWDLRERGVLSQDLYAALAPLLGVLVDLPRHQVDGTRDLESARIVARAARELALAIELSAENSTTHKTDSAESAEDTR